MRHAYLILAHSDFGLLNTLLRSIDFPGDAAYIHIDAKAPFTEADRRAVLAGVSFPCRIYREYKVYWGDISITRAEIFLMEKALEDGFDYCHLLSGADLPLWGDARIHAFFEEHRGRNFIQFNDRQLKRDPEAGRRARLYHPLIRLRRGNVFFTFLDRCLIAAQLVMRVDRTRGLDWVIKLGSNWCSITSALASEIVSRKEKIERVFKLTSCSDEMFIQTVAYNAGYMPTVVNDNLRYIDFPGGKNGSPKTLTREDLPAVMSSGSMFARKFDTKTSAGAIAEVLDGRRTDDFG